MVTKPELALGLTCLLVASAGCGRTSLVFGDEEQGFDETFWVETVGDGDGDGDWEGTSGWGDGDGEPWTGDGDGDWEGDGDPWIGDGEPGDGDPWGDGEPGDGDPWGDGEPGDGDPWGDGDPGDGDPGDGDPGDGDPGDGDPGDGDGDWEGDGDPWTGDGEPGDGDPWGDGEPGDGDPWGDGEPGDGDPGDGDPGDGDPGDGDPGDGDPGDGDGDPNACIDSLDCMEGNCINGSCEVVATCLEIEQLDANAPSGIYELDHDGPGGDPAYANYCDLDTDGGGWTLVIKARADSQVFNYDSPEWTSPAAYAANEYFLDRVEAKLPSWAWVDFTQIRVGFEQPVGVDPDPIFYESVTLPIAGTSLYDVISPGAYVPTNLGRNAWLGTIQGSALQPNCNREGINATGQNLQQWHRVRIGIIANEQNNCITPDSRLGIGGTGNVCNTQPRPVGNYAGCNGNNNVNIQAFGLVFVR